MNRGCISCNFKGQNRMIHPCVRQNIIHFGMVGRGSNRLVECRVEICSNSTNCIQFTVIFSQRKGVPSKTHIRHLVPSIGIGIVAHESVGRIRTVFETHASSGVYEIANMVHSYKSDCFATCHWCTLHPCVIGCIVNLDEPS